jgi:uncharacterized protein (TIGR03435 family)
MNAILVVLTAVVNSLWQALAVAILVWLALRFLPKINAATRYAIWWAALGVGLVLPVAPRLIQAMRPLPRTIAATAVKTPQVVAQPVNAEPVIVPVAPGRTAMWPIAVFAVWSAILLWRLGQLGRSYLYLRGIKRRAVVSPMPLPAIPRHADLLISQDVFSPMAVGFLRPAVVLPESLLAELTEPEREHVLLHEAAHLARNDDWANLAMRIVGGALALHPVAIWILRQIEHEREMACDDWVVARTGSARPYAASLAHLFELRRARRGEILASGIFGRNSRIGDRIEVLLRRGRTFSPRASVSGVIVSAIALSALLLAGSLTPRWIAFAQEQAGPAFEIASVKPNTSGKAPTYYRFFGETVTLKNQTLKNILVNAWQVRAFQVLGGPGWINSDRYDVEAKAPGNPAVGQKRLMLQTLLADRFQLALHRETRELPIYRLTVAKSGLKLQPPNCIAGDPVNPTPAQGKTRMDYCGYGGFAARGEFEASDESMADLAVSLSYLLGRTVVDETRIKGTFRVRLTFAPDDAAIRLPELPGDPAPAADAGPSVFAAVQEQLGLKLESGKGPVEVLVIDHVEKPDAN